MKYRFICSLLFMALLPASAEQSRVSSQKELESMLQRVGSGEAVDISLAPGTYQLGSVTAKAALKISGDGAVIKGPADVYSKKDAVRTENGFYVCRLTSEIPPFSLFLDEKDEIIPVSESVDDKTMVNFCDEVKGEYGSRPGAKIRFPVPPAVDTHSATEFSSYGYFDCEWRVGIFSIDGVEGGEYLCTMLNRVDTGDFNYEVAHHKSKVRYVIFNAALKPGCISYTINEIYIPEKYGSVQVVKSGGAPCLTAQSDLTLKGIEFRNFGGISVSSNGAETVAISGCSFVNSLSTSVEVRKKTSDGRCVISDCSFLHCGLVDGYTLNLRGPMGGEPSILVENCRMKRYEDGPLMYKNAYGMMLLKGDAEVRGCTLTNTPRTPVLCYQGVNIVRDNVVFNTEGFNSFRERNLSNDFGMIYVNCFTRKSSEALSNTIHRAVIEDNFVYGALAFATNARGIMIDDGRGDVICRRNVVHVPGAFFSIGSRECPKYIGTSSVRNVFEDNVVTTRYRLQGGVELGDHDLPVICRNFILGKMENPNRRVTVRKDDAVFEDAEVAGVENGKLVVDAKTRNALKKLIRSRFIK